MTRVAVLTLLVASILTGSTQAQRTGGIFRGHAAGVGVRPGFIGQRGFSRGFIPRRGVFPNRFHLRRDGFGAVVVPYFFPYEEPFAYEQASDETVASAPVPPVVIVERDEGQSQTPETPKASPQVIEIPGAPTATAAQPLPPTIFILANGERVETRRFVLTASNLFVTVGRQQRTIPLDLLDIDTTVTANREHGIDLRIPADRNEISLSF